jgi:hypothetical protein
VRRPLNTQAPLTVARNALNRRAFGPIERCHEDLPSGSSLRDIGRAVVRRQAAVE